MFKWTYMAELMELARHFFPDVWIPGYTCSRTVHSPFRIFMSVAVVASASNKFEGKKERANYFSFPWVKCGKFPLSAFFSLWGGDEKSSDSLLILAMLTPVSGRNLSQKYVSSIRSKWEGYCSLQDCQPFLKLKDTPNRFDWIHNESILRTLKAFFTFIFCFNSPENMVGFKRALCRNAYSSKTQGNT